MDPETLEALGTFIWEVVGAITVLVVVVAVWWRRRE